jgi:hypothetical protein
MQAGQACTLKAVSTSLVITWAQQMQLDTLLIVAGLTGVADQPALGLPLLALFNAVQGIL